MKNFKITLSVLFIFLFSGYYSLAYNLDSLMNIVEIKYSKVKDYTCKLSKKEMINGDYVSWNNVVYKFKKPDCYYMKWNEGTMDGMELIYAGKKYKNKIVGHLGGILNIKNFDLPTNSSLIMKQSRHSILESDMGFIIRLMKTNLQKAKSLGVGKISYVKDLSLNKRKVSQFRAEFPANKGFYGHVINIYLDKSLSMPIKFEVYDWNDKLIESYTFSNLKLNCGLKDNDFDKNNNAYGF